MANASTGTDDSRGERAESDSSEVGSTRPNPFDDSGLFSRKRQKTSLSGASRSLSVETVQSPRPSPPNQDVGSAPEPRSDSAMRIDTDADPTTPTTPETQKSPLRRPPHGNHSSSVTINVRTPSRPQKTGASSIAPSSPPPAVSPANSVHASVEEPETNMACRDGNIVETPESLRSDSNSPPVEVIHIDSDDSDDEYNALIDGPSKDPFLQPFGRQQVPDPSDGFPYQDPSETALETINRLSNFITDHEAVSKALAAWIEKYLDYAQHAPYYEVLESWRAHRSTWLHLPELALTLVNHKRNSNQPMAADVFHAMFAFYKQFARLTAFFIQHDSRVLKTQDLMDPAWVPDLASMFYAHVLGLITRREELTPRGDNHVGAVVDAWGWNVRVAEVLDAFLTFSKTQGGTMAYVKQLAASETELLPRVPRLNEHLSQLSAVVCNVLYLGQHRYLNGLDENTGNIFRAHVFWKTVSTALGNIIDKHVNHLSLDTAQTLLPALSEIHQYCLGLDAIPELNELKAEHRLRYPLIQESHRSEVMALRWKFLQLRKLIVSSQMQLRVMAVTAMCSDLVTVWRRFGDGTMDFNRPVIDFFSKFLLETELVTYILGPNCHPEITLESTNIVGFLAISGTYTTDHTDAAWQTFTCSQDPRVQDALIRMMNKVSNLLSNDALLYLSDKVLSLPVESFTPAIRELWETINKHMRNKGFAPQPLGLNNMASYEICARLLRHASVPGNQTPIAYPELQKIAIQRMDELLGGATPDECRQLIYLDCLHDISRKTPYTSGSLWILCRLLRFAMARDLRPLTAKHDLPKLLVDEMEAAISAMRTTGCTVVLSGALNTPRVELLSAIIHREPGSISKDLGWRLWGLLVGPGAASREDRDVGWNLLDSASKTVDKDGGMNPFVGLCFSDFFPTLTKEYFCQGALDFAYAQLTPLLGKESVILDQEVAPRCEGIAQLWRMILTAPVGTIERRAIALLVDKIYLNSECIVDFSHHRALKVHLSLVDRCFELLSGAAAELKAMRGTSNDGDTHSVEGLEQELVFVRSLSVLREFYSQYRTHPRFCQAFDMSRLSSELPSEVLGDPAQLKYQSFDGDAQAEIQALSIGRLNTVGALLSTLREATGFQDYRIYYRGFPFVPQQADIFKTLKDCKIHDGNLLIKHEVGSPETPRGGAQSVEGRILSHFKELWDYLSLKKAQDSAQAVYRFLVTLPVDPNILRAISDPSTPYREILSPGEPLRNLYALLAMRDYISTQRHQTSPAQHQQYLDDPTSNECPISIALSRVMALVVSIISDRELTEGAKQECHMDLSSSLIDLFAHLLDDRFLPVSATQRLDAPLLDRLFEIASTVRDESPPHAVTKYLSLCLRSIFLACSRSPDFMAAFRTHAPFRAFLGDVLLHDERKPIRHNAAQNISQLVSGGVMAATNELTRSWRQYFWPLVSELVGPALDNPRKSAEVLNLCVMMFKLLKEGHPDTLDLQKHLDDWLDCLLHYQTFEDATKPDVTDLGVSKLLKLLQMVLCNDESRQRVTPPSAVSRKIFWTHLYPPPESLRKFSPVAHNKPILCPDTRVMLVTILFSLIEEDDTAQLMSLLEDLHVLVPVYDETEDGPYAYDLHPGSFDRAKAIRAPCGYAGIKNLSNTCYFNSLLAQLYMNIDFRRFVLGTQGSGPDQALLFETRKLFGHMQNSLHRFVVPEELVRTIKTYEDTDLDIHNQMDVDEFYNLWNDRLESQFLNSAERTQFRSFYGGQLVQQVASKECEHISERLEPFSAIQCDIKGKSSLEESLQTYVDGEIMEGENKYKCSECDRHVDAVKRTCLKDIPDNLIFHLKRFDFNLRQMQRNKINDKFAFPAKIDMRPYTIEYLSDSPGGKDEDVFELVGVLVHSGTAESGHYYSYSRERPSSSVSPAWLEFNDDVVSPWDPALMESACFGGLDYRDKFEANGGMIDKTYSAYMLFFQRSSSLAKSQALLEQTGCPSPLAVALPQEMGRYIDEENLLILRRHCMYDDVQIKFVSMALQRLRFHQEGCSPNHAMEKVGIPMALGFLDQVASRVKDTGDFLNLLEHIMSMCRVCSHCSMIAFEYLRSYPSVFRFLAQKSPEGDVRRGVGRLLILILETLKAFVPAQYGLPMDESPPSDRLSSADSGSDGDGGRWTPPPRTVLSGVMNMFEVLWETFHTSLRAWPETFDLMLAFVQMGPSEMRIFLQQPFLCWLLYIIAADAHLVGIPIQFIKMINTVHRRTARPPSYEAIIRLVDVLTRRAKLGHGINSAAARFRYHQDDDADGPYPFTNEETKILEYEWGHGNFFTDKLLGINQYPMGTYSIIRHLIKQNKRMELQVQRTLVQNINGLGLPHTNQPYLLVAGDVFCPHASQAELVDDLIQHVSKQCMAFRNVDGRALLAFQCAVFDGAQSTGRSPEQIVMAGYGNIAGWAPGLLGSADPEVVKETELFLDEKLFEHPAAPIGAAGGGGGWLAEAIVKAARQLGSRCLEYLRTTYIERQEEVSARLVVGVERTIHRCSLFYDSELLDGDQFLRMRNSTLESLRQLTVEDIDEDADGMFYSDSSSIASSNTAG